MNEIMQSMLEKDLAKQHPRMAPSRASRTNIWAGF
jgi:hypothetical protein